MEDMFDGQSITNRKQIMRLFYMQTFRKKQA